MLDTDIASYIMKRSHAAVLEKLRTVAVSDVCISAITKAELMYGVEVSPRPQKDRAALNEFLRYIEVLEFPADAALDYGQIRADLKARGEMIGSSDLLIAAHARCLGLILATNNTREFSRVKGLKIENWTEPGGRPATEPLVK
jgi:tRNA(fMet)-specific endonuclease VapC